MKNPKISQILKGYRKSNHLTVPEVSELLKSYHIIAAPKTVYGWESGQTQPTADTLLLLCKIYHIDDVLTTFGYKEEEELLILSDDEKSVVRAYRMNQEMKAAVHRLLRVEAVQEQMETKQEEI